MKSFPDALKEVYNRVNHPITIEKLAVVDDSVKGAAGGQGRSRSAFSN